MRLAAGWTVVLLAAVTLNLVVVAPTTAPESGVLGDAWSPTPEQPPSASPGSSGYQDDVLPPIPQRPPIGSGVGSARPVQLAALPEQDSIALQAAVDRARLQLGLHALTVGVAVDGRFGWAGASGLARDGETKLDGDSPFAIASVTKTFTAALVMQLVEERRVLLDNEVADLLPDAGVPAGVTVRMLLSHTSGVADLLAPMRDPMNAEPERRWTAAEVVARVGPTWFAPGSGYGYSNTNFVLLGMLVEKLTGQAFETVLARRLLHPLELGDSGVLLSDGAPLLMTPSWASAFGASGFMYSSARDLLEWGEALYGGRVVRPATLAHMLAFGEQGYGLGTERVQLGTHQGYGHSGLLRGFTGLLVHLPDAGLTLVVIGTWQGFDPAAALTATSAGQPSILDLALLAAARGD